MRICAQWLGRQFHARAVTRLLLSLLSNNFKWIRQPTSSGTSALPRMPPREIFAPSDVGDYGKRIYRAAEETKVKKALCDTLGRLSTKPARDTAVALGMANLARCKEAIAAPAEARPRRRQRSIRFIRGDWGDVTGKMTKEFGEIFTVLVHANGHSFGGGYPYGCPQMEENYISRTNGHFCSGGAKRGTGKYDADMRRVLSGVDGLVYLDMEHVRVCVTGSAMDGFAKFEDEQVFVFHELRAAAVDCSEGEESFDYAEAKKRIKAQFETCMRKGVRHVVLGAFGCGAFENPAKEVAKAYMEVLGNYRRWFDVVAFAIYTAPYDTQDNYKEFVDAFKASAEEGRWKMSQEKYWLTWSDMAP
jgi:hypothetical protein